MCLDDVSTAHYVVTMAKKATKPSEKAGAKSSVMPIRVTPEEKARWQAAAAADRRTLSDWIRIVADDAAAKGNAPTGPGK